MTVAVVAASSACAMRSAPGPDVGTDAAANDSGARDAAGDSTGSTCSPWYSAQNTCCVFASGACPQPGFPADRTACAWYFGDPFTGTENDPPAQRSGFCLAPGAVSDGGACLYGDSHNDCAPGLWCAWNNGQLQPAGSMGTCRPMCDPTDATRGCATGRTCVGMPSCTGGATFPDCPSLPTADIGYCLP